MDPSIRRSPARTRARSVVNPLSERLQHTAECALCAGGRFFEISGFREMAIQGALRERLYKEVFSDATPFYMLKDRAYATQEYAARLVCCEDCGTVSRDPRLSPRGVVEQYSEDDYHPRWLETSFREFYEAYTDRMPELLRWVGPDAEVLEVGSFVGGFLAAARDQGWRGTGVDVGDCVVSFARERGLDVRKGTLSSVGFPPESFDAVFVWSCFDQLPHPEDELEEIHRVLREGGRLLIRVPNGEFVKWMHRLLHTAPDATKDLVRRILVLTGLAAFPFQVGYTPASLARLARDHGFGSIQVRNRINLRGASPDRTSFWELPGSADLLRRVHASSQLLSFATLGFLSWGPWIEMCCSKKASLAAQADEALLSIA